MVKEWIEQKLSLRSLIQKLEAHPHVLKVTKKPNYLKVIFDTGTPEYWALNYKGLKKPRAILLPFTREHFNDYLIPSYKQFEANEILYPEDYKILKDHFIIKKSDLDKAGWCDVRFKVHDLAVELVEAGYIPPQYTNEILQEDYYALLEEKVERYQYGLIRFSAFSHLPPSGRRLIMHFMPCAAKDKWDFYNVYKTINRLLSRDITREDIVYYLSKNHHIARHPAFHRAVFRQWCDVKGKNIYDLHPDWGFRALAVLAEGGNYYCDSPQMPHFKKMASFIGGKIEDPIETHYDLIMLSDVHPIEKEEAHSLIRQYRGLGDKLMVSIKKEDLNEFVIQYKPENVLRLSNDVTRDANKDNHIVMIRS